MYSPGSEGIINRRMVFCERLSTSFDTTELITECPDCFCFSALCCQHEPSICHHFELVFTDGSCLNNGKANSTSGIGIAIGSVGIGVDQWSIPVDDAIDSNAKRTSQRAELLAAIEGLRRISTEYNPHHTPERHTGRNPQCFIIVTDSEYVVKGMTEWLPVWKASCTPN
jgi:ribonuclease HI